MKFITFSEPIRSNYSTMLLTGSLNIQKANDYYIKPYLNEYKDSIINFEVKTDPKRTKVTTIETYMDQINKYCKQLGVTNLIVTDGDYFKYLTKVKKLNPQLGYKLNSFCNNYNVFYCPSYKNIYYNPEVINNIKLALVAVNNHLKGTYQDLGTNIIHSYKFLYRIKDIKEALDNLLTLNQPLTADIETFSLKFDEAGLGTISLSTDKHNGIVIACDVTTNQTKVVNYKVRALLKDFFIQFSKINKLIWHNCSYDITVLIYQLFMSDLEDIKGLLEGLEVFTNNFDDTKIISYLALNSTSKPSLSLKDLSHEFSGNYAVEDIKDILQIPFNDLCKYNLIDCLSTWYVYEKYYDLMVQDKQLELYEGLFKDTLKDIIQMQLTGLPIKMDQVKSTHKELENQLNAYLDNIHNSKIISKFNYYLKEQEVNLYNSTRVKKRITFDDATAEFNPNSNPQLVELLYSNDFMALPVLDLTDKGNPATSSKTISKLINHTENQEYRDLLSNLVEYNKLNKILTAFFPAFLNAKECNSNHYLYGFFNLGGTVSGRLSSNNINLQNLPSTGSKYAKPVKKCFGFNNKEWLFVGADFNALEDRIICLLTKDPVRRSIYLDGYDGHCRNSYAYYTEQMPDIQLAEPQEKCYKANEKVIYQGKEFTGEELYAYIKN
jgi:DNA polymerase I